MYILTSIVVVLCYTTRVKNTTEFAFAHWKISKTMLIDLFVQFYTSICKRDAAQICI